MRTNYYIALAMCSLLWCPFLSAQETNSTPITFKNEIAFDASFVLDRLALGVPEFPASLYEITYRRRREKVNFRCSVGGDFDQTTFSFPTIENETFAERQWHLVGKLGVEKSTVLGKRWEAFFGLDGILNLAVVQEPAISLDDIVLQTETVQEGIGISPFIGVRFSINDRVSLYTDCNYTLVFASVTEKFSILREGDASFVPEIPDPVEFRTVDLNFEVPIHIHAAIRL